MNPAVTSRETILRVSRELIRQRGGDAISIRSVAAACGVSVGSIYNYFDSKTALVSATVESIWNEMFHRPEDEAVSRDAQAYIVRMYEQMEAGCRQYPGFFARHSLGFLQEEKADGKRRMHEAWQRIWNGLCSVLKQDTRIRSDAFTETFTAERFSDVLFSLMLSALLRQDYNPAAVLEIVRRVLYENHAAPLCTDRPETGMQMKEEIL